MPASKIKGFTWTTTRLGSVATIIMGQSPPSSTVNEKRIGLPFIQGNAEFGPRYPRPVKFCTDPKKLAASGDILLSVRAPVGAMNLADEQLCIGRGLSAITAIGIDPEFLWYALARRLSSLVRVAQGSTFTAVNKADLHELEFLLPSPNEQRKIAAILSSVDDAIEKTQSVIDQAQVVKRGLMQELLTRRLPGRHRQVQVDRDREETGRDEPDGWRPAYLGDLARVNPEQLGSRTDSDYLLEYLDITAIERPGVFGSSRTFRFSEAPSRARRLAREGDILVSTVRPYLRNFARIREAPDNLVVSTGYAVIRPEDGVDGGFLYQHVLSARFVEFLKPRMSGSNYPAITADDVEAYPLFLPPLPEQRKIAAIHSSVDDTIEENQTIMDRLRVLKIALMSALLTGELRVTPTPEAA